MQETLKGFKLNKMNFNVLLADLLYTEPLAMARLMIINLAITALTPKGKYKFTLTGLS